MTPHSSHLAAEHLLKAKRAGASSLEVILLMGVTVTMIAALYPIVRQMIQLTFQLSVNLICWPFM
jgi:hypothetical protein